MNVNAATYDMDINMKGSINKSSTIGSGVLRTGSGMVPH